MINIEVESYPFFSGQALVTEVDEILTKADFVAIFTDCQYVGQFNIIYIKRDLLNDVSEELRKSYVTLKYINFSLIDFLRIFFSRFNLNKMSKRLILKS